MKHYTLLILALFAAISSYAIAPIVGPTTVCAGDTIFLSDATLGGTWSSSATATASVGTNGHVIGIAAGVATISYTSGGSTAIMSVTVNALPVLSSSLTPATICDSTAYFYAPTSFTTGVSFAWSRPYVSGIADSSASGTGAVSEILFNTTPLPISAIYTYTLSTSTCSNTENVSVIVNPKPMLSSSLNPPPICDSTIFSYTPSSSTIGSEFDWFRVAATGIHGSSTGSGTGNPLEQLSNTTVEPIPITYIYIIYYNGCLNEENISVTVNPSPVLSSPLILPDICDSFGMITYTPTSATPGAVFAWDRPAITGITPATSFFPAGTGIISEILTDIAHHPIAVTYFYRLGIGTCTNLYTQAVTVTIDSCAFLATPISPNMAEIDITPNPTTGPITINNLLPNDEIEIFSTLGKKIFTHKQLSGSSATISLTNEPSGMYYVRINSAGNIQTQKIVKQ